MKRKNLLIFIIIFIAVFSLAKTASAATATWDGGGTSFLWSEAANWANDTIPETGSDVTFNVTSTKDSLVDAAFINNIQSLTLTSAYTGTISLAANLSFTGGTPSFSQAGGTFMETYDTAGSNPFNLTGLTSGQITATGGTFYGPNKPAGASGSTTPATRIATVAGLQGVKNSLALKYVQTANLTSVGAFVSYIIGTASIPFTGSYNGYGYSIDGLTISATAVDAGLFGNVGTGAIIRNVGLTNVVISSTAAKVGALVGYNVAGTITNCYSTGTVSGSANAVGGLVGRMDNISISNSYSTATVTETGTGANVGGLVGNFNSGTITNSYATGAVTSSGGVVGGFVGTNVSGTISNSYATGNVSVTATAVNTVGGFAGSNGGTISNSYATGSVTVTTTGDNFSTGGFAGQSSGTISSSYSTGNVSAKRDMGGFIGWQSGGSITSSYTTGNVTGNGIEVGGFVGNNAATISNSYATGTVTQSSASGYSVGGFVGYNYNGVTIISNSYATGNVSSASHGVGGFVGWTAAGTITNSYSKGNVTGIGGVAGFVGEFGYDGLWPTISYSYSTGIPSGGDYCNGGFMGIYVTGTNTANFWDTTTSTKSTGTDCGSSTGITGKTTSQMMTQSTFQPGSNNWDFSTPVWRIVPNITYPYLSGQSSNPIIIFGKNIIFGFNMIFKL
jgi:hypothetical protein